MATEKIICDTDVMIDYFDEKRQRFTSTKIIIEEGIGLDNIVLSAITKIELIAGASNKTELRSINKKIQRFGLLLINPEISTTAIDLMQFYRLSHGLALSDAFIAATSVYTQIPLFTCNLKDYRFISGLSLYQSK